MSPKINTKNYLVINSYAKDGITTEDFKEVLKICFANNTGVTFNIIVGVYKDSLVFPQENILSRKDIIADIISQNFTSTYIGSETIWSE